MCVCVCVCVFTIVVAHTGFLYSSFHDDFYLFFVHTTFTSNTFQATRMDRCLNSVKNLACVVQIFYYYYYFSFFVLFFYRLEWIGCGGVLSHLHLVKVLEGGVRIVRIEWRGLERWCVCVCVCAEDVVVIDDSLGDARKVRRC